MDMLAQISQLLSLNDFWNWAINLFVSFIGNYGWAIILFTVALKLILVPLDYFQRRATIKNTQMQSIVQPEIAKIEKKFAGNKQMINQKTMEIYKKNNYNVVGTCVVMLVNIVLTFVIFISLFSALNGIASSKLTAQFDRLQIAYQSSVVETEQREAVLDEFEQIKSEDGWLWINNVWRPDNYSKQMQSFDEYYKGSKLKLDEEAKSQLKAEYNAIEEIIYSSKSNSGWNGYLILTVVAAIVSVLAQIISTKTMKPASAKKPDAKEGAAPDATQATNKMMIILMPVIMVIFTFTSNAIFGIYIITNSAMSALIAFVLNKIITRKTKTDDSNPQIVKPAKKQVKKKAKVVDYSRNYFKGDTK